MNVLDQFGLRIGGAGDQNSAGIGNRLDDRLKVFMVLGGMSAADTIGFMVDVSCRMIRGHHKPLHLGRVEMKHASLPVIDPDDSMIVMISHGMPL